MDPLELFQRLAIALAIGLLIGVERGWKEREDPEGERTAGVRTFALAGLLGGIWGAIAWGLGNVGVVAMGIAFAAFAAIFAYYRLREMQHQGSFGVTTVVAAMLAFALGAYAVLGDMVLAAAAGVAATLLLALKAMLHDWLRRLTWSELRSGLVLLAMTVILLPVLPNRAFGPFGALNPYEIWLMTVLIAVVSFVGYIAVRLTGERRGVVLSGLAGGLVSSTAATMSFARLAKEHPAEVRLLTSGAVLAGAMMMLRILFVAGLFNTKLITWLAPPVLMAAIGMLGAAALLLLRQGDFAAAEPLNLKNPFELKTVLSFGILLAIVLFLAKAVLATVGAGGVYVLAAVSGLADVDAITLSMARLGADSMPPRAASLAILVAAITNTLSKAALSGIAGGKRPALYLSMSAAAALAAGAAGLALAQWWE